MSVRHDYRFFAPVLFAWAGTAALLNVPEASFLVAGCSLTVSASVFVLLATARFRSSRFISGLLITPALALAIFGALSLRVGVEAHIRQVPEPNASALAGQPGRAVASEPRTWRAFATSTPTSPRSQSRFGDNQTLQLNAIVTAIETGASSLHLTVPVRITGPASELEQVVIGSQLEFNGHAKELPSASSAAYRIAAHDIRVSPPHPILAFTHTLRAGLQREARQHTGWGSELIPGLAVGDTTLVSEELDSAMKTSSLSHLTAVSGANCAIITGIILALGSVLRWRRWLRIALASTFLASFVVLVTPEPSVLRAAVMSFVAMVAVLASRKGSGVPVLGLAILVLLILDPWQAQHLGFVLSVLATAGIVMFTEPIAQVFRRFLPSWLALVIAVPVAAQLTCQPAIILLQPTLPTFGVLANILAAPAAPIATVVGLIACVLVWLVPPLGAFATWLTWFPASYIAAIAQFFAAVPVAQLPWLDGWVGALLLATLTAAVILAFFRPSRVAVARRGTQSGETWRWIVASLSVSVLLAIAVVRPATTWMLLPKDWRIFMCDVGQGDAVLVRGSAGIMLIDTGINPELVKDCLDVAGVHTVDLLVVSHDDRDHAGGLPGIVSRVTNALVSPAVSDEPRLVLTPLVTAHVPTQIATRGMRGTLGDLNWQVLAPAANASLHTTNDASVVVRIDAPELSALFLGDLGEDAQERLMRDQPLNPVDVVKVSHHGSADQSAELYARLGATFGLVSVGENNGYGHPTPSLLASLQDARTAVIRTDTEGAIAIARDRGGRWRVWASAAVG